MPIERILLGVARPLDAAVADWLLAAGQAGLADLRDTTVVVPTRQAGWRLHAALAVAAEARGSALFSPEIVGAAVLLAPPAAPDLAGGLDTLLAWREVLAAAPPGDADAFLGATRPAAGAGTAWALGVARRLQSLRDELADGGLGIDDVAARGAALAECERWQALAELERRYLARLAAWGLRDAVAAKVAAARGGAPPSGLRRVVLAALLDPPNLLVHMLDRWADAGIAVAALVAADPADAEAFDAWGRPRPDRWCERRIDLPDADIALLATPEDQARFIADAIASAAASSPCPAAGRSRPRVAVGVPDADTIAPLQRELAGRGLSAFDPRNRPLADTALYRLVRALLDFARHPGYAETAALLRHPDTLAALDRPAAVLRDLDAAQAEHLPVTLDDLLARRAALSPGLAAALDRLDGWGRALRREPLAPALRGVLQDVYARRRLTAGRPGDETFRQAAGLVDAALRELEAAAAAGRAADGAADALLVRLGGESLKPDRADEDLDLEGWLELPWNPAPVLFVAGMNEGLVPDSRVSDLLLPDALRRDLGLRDDRLRVARDAQLLDYLAARRRAGGRLVLLAGRTSPDGDPLRPSRLLFRCADEHLVGRVAALFREVPPARFASPYAASFTLQPAQVPPSAVSDRVLRRLSPSVFRDYLACPLRFHLRRVLGMEPRDDRSREPDARAFGTLVHAALERMARDPGRPWAGGDADRLAAWLEDALRAAAEDSYGRRPWLGVVLATEAAVQRLRAFAAAQVAWHAAGWDLDPAESERTRECAVAGLPIVGRIDRVDRRRDDPRVVCVLDYKTTDSARKLAPPDAHLGPPRAEETLPEAAVPGELLAAAAAPDARGRAPRPRRWADLQLPLYREMLRAGGAAGIQLGYVALPAALGDTGFRLWDGYTDALHASALRCAEAVIARVRQGVFWPPGEAPGPQDDFAGLLLADAEAAIARPRPWGGAP